MVLGRFAYNWNGRPNWSNGADAAGTAQQRRNRLDFVKKHARIPANAPSRLGNIKTKHPTVKPVDVMTHTRGTGGNHD
jgi:hypothetical protein